MVIGTDAGIGRPKPHGVLPHAATQLLGAGISPAESLRMMTFAAAAIRDVRAVYLRGARVR